MAAKPNFTRKKKRSVHGTAFWDREYTNPEHLQLSMNESEDLAKFTRWLVRQKRTDIFEPHQSVVDIGCGNGRNLIYLSKTFGVRGVGYDSSTAAIAQARHASKNLPIAYSVHKAELPIPLPDASQSLALDMMTSHFLNESNRRQLRDEIFRTLVPGGFLFMKTFLRDGDLHTERLLKDAPGSEAGTYIHPVMGVPEHAYTEEELLDFLRERFIIHKVYRSHKHVSRGKARRRRTISVYAEKDY